MTLYHLAHTIGWAGIGLMIGLLLGEAIADYEDFDDD